MPIKYSCINDGANLISEFPPEEQPKLAATLKSVLDSVPPREYRRQTAENADVNLT